MAIIKGGVFDGASKSIGNITLRNVNGQTIASAKVSRNNSNTHKQAARRSSFGLLSKLGSALKPIVDLGFDPVKHGSRCNNFTQSNADLANYFTQSKTEKPPYTPVQYLYKALTDPTFIGQAFASKGNLTSRSEFILDEEGHLNAIVTLSRDYLPADTLTVATILLYTHHQSTGHLIELTTHTIGTQEIPSLPNPRQYLITKTTHPTLNLKTLFHFPATLTAIITTAIITTPTDRSTATFTVPTNPPTP
jgi:hypothetical protein